MGTILMICKTCMPVDPYRLITFFDFWCFHLTAMYLASSFYHLLKVDEKWITLLRRIDHIMIFIFIASTYTPICLVAIKGSWGWSLFGVVWGIALSGFFIKVFWMNAPRWLSTVFHSHGLALRGRGLPHDQGSTCCGIDLASHRRDSLPPDCHLCPQKAKSISEYAGFP